MWEDRKDKGDNIVFDIHTWALICMTIAEKDMDALGDLYFKAQEIKETSKAEAELKFR